MVHAGMSYDEVAQKLGVSPGLVYLVATGHPADGSDSPSGANGPNAAPLLKPSQHLANPDTVENPTSRQSVLDWVKRRAAADAQMQAAALARTPDEPANTVDDEEPDLVDLLTRDHNRVDALLEELATIPGVWSRTARPPSSRLVVRWST
jgi:hypothetical protein